MVDFAITINPDDVLRERIRRTLGDKKDVDRSLNQTYARHMLYKPIVFSIETKIPFTGGEISDVQLSAWQDAWTTKISQLLEANGKAKVKIPTMPLLSIHGHDVHISAFFLRETESQLLGKLYLGSTDTIQGIYKILKGLEILVDWSNTTYGEWFCSNVLKP